MGCLEIWPANDEDWQKGFLVIFSFVNVKSFFFLFFIFAVLFNVLITIIFFIFFCQSWTVSNVRLFMIDKIMEKEMWFCRMEDRGYVAIIEFKGRGGGGWKANCGFPTVMTFMRDKFDSLHCWISYEIDLNRISMDTFA